MSNPVQKSSNSPINNYWDWGIIIKKLHTHLSKRAKEYQAELTDNSQRENREKIIEDFIKYTEEKLKNINEINELIETKNYKTQFPEIFNLYISSMPVVEQIDFIIANFGFVYYSILSKKNEPQSFTEEDLRDILQ